MQFCLIDSDADYREILRYHIAVAWPDATICDFASLAEAEADAEALAGSDALLLAWPVTGESGLGALPRLFDRSRYPPVVLFADGGDELLAVDMLKAGAASYFPKRGVTHQRLIETLRTELGAARRPRAALVGTHGQFRFIEELHSTEIATVLLAEHIGGDAEPIAIKLLRYVPDAGGERLFDRFLQEYEIIARIEHPHVVRIFDLGIADDHAFIAMEYLGAGRLSDRLNQPLPADRAIGYLLQIASALAAVHAAGILHRDLKPANIMFRDDDSIALIDFGLAKSMRLEAALTGHGQIFGTPYYMSPEQGHAEPTDARSDLYSLGCVLYECLAGERPFTASTAMGVIYQHANAPRPRLQGPLERYQPLLERLLAIDPAERFESALALTAAAEALRVP
jgi:serine/threonine protein kinase